MEILSNRLSESSSTYLQQHQDNPVHWQLWDQPTLALAKAEDRPILLSIGYAACHWCHVMAHECFEDESIAALMNQHFINVKVDRQQRPDLDSQYQLTHQLFTGRGGGWPLTIMLDPQDLTPFFAGTYFPPEPARGMPGFADLLVKLSELFQQRRDDLREQSTRIKQALQQIGSSDTHTDDLHREPLETARERLLQSIDEQYGGIGGAPKFPRCPELNLLAQQAMHGDSHSELALRQCLQAMLDGGLYDHLGGGFFRYCVDGQWQIPHFEKMLYDNAQLIPLLAGQAEHLSGASAALSATAEWLRRRMAVNPLNNVTLYAAALDADSLDTEGHASEGAYYVWQPERIQALLDPADYAEFADHYSLSQPPNFEDSYWHLQRQPGDAFKSDLEQSRNTLLEQRQQRSLPTLDSQALCGWNALLADGLLRAGYQLNDSALQEQGVQLCTDLLHCMWDTKNHCLHQFIDNRSEQPATAFLDDTAALLQAMLTRLKADVFADELATCVQLANYLLDQFYDSEHGGFWLAPPQHTDLLVRSKPYLDDATPAANAMACQALLQLGHLTGEQRYLNAVEQTLRAGWEDMQRYSTAASSMLRVLDRWLDPVPQVLACGTFDDVERQQWLAKPGLDCYFLEPDTEWESADDSLLKSLVIQTPEQPVKIMVCAGTRCLPLCDSLEAAQHLLGEL